MEPHTASRQAMFGTCKEALRRAELHRFKSLEEADAKKMLAETFGEKSKEVLYNPKFSAVQNSVMH